MTDDVSPGLDHVAANGSEIPCCEHFDYGAIDRGNPLVAEIEGGRDEFSMAGDGFSAILHWCWQGGAKDMQAAFVKFVAVTALVNPELLNSETYKVLGGRLGVGKAAVSKVAVEFQEHFSVHFRRSRRESGREAMRLARLKQVAAKKEQ